MKNDTPKIKDLRKPEIKDEEINTIDLSPDFEAPPVERHRPSMPAYDPAVEQVLDAVPGVGAPPMEFWDRLIDKLSNNKQIDQQNAADLHAYAMRKAMHPEEPSPLISVFNPHGEREHPRPRPTCAYYLRSFPICDPGDYATVTWTELELLSQLQPGSFKVTKSDGQQVQMAVIPEYDSTGTKMTKVTLDLPIGDDEQKNNWPPLIQLLTEAITGESPAHSVARMQARIAELEAQLAASAA